MTPCWEWSGQIDRDGYGRRSGHLAHRLVFEATRGPIPAGLQLDHLCRNRRCVNPDHLEAVTNAENQRRGVAARPTCLWGHVFDAGNTYFRKSGGLRQCRTCNRQAQRRRRIHAPSEGVSA